MSEITKVSGHDIPKEAYDSIRRQAQWETYAHLEECFKAGPVDDPLARIIHERYVVGLSVPPCIVGFGKSVISSSTYVAGQELKNKLMASMLEKLKQEDHQVCDECARGTGGEDVPIDRIRQVADHMVRARIERLADKVLAATDEAGAKDGMTVAEILGVLEMAKVEISRRAYEETT